MKKIYLASGWFNPTQDEELTQLGIKGQEFIYEVFNEIPLIGMDEKARKEYNEKITEYNKYYTDTYL